MILGTESGLGVRQEGGGRAQLLLDVGHMGTALVQTWAPISPVTRSVGRKGQTSVHLQEKPQQTQRKP